MLLPLWLSGKESACRSWSGVGPWGGGVGVSTVSRGVDPWVEKTHLRRKHQSMPEFLPGKSHRCKSLAGYSPWCSKISRTRLSNWKFLLSRFSRVRLCGILWTRILKWVTMPSSRGSSQPRKQTCVSSPVLAGRFFTTSTEWEAHLTLFLHIRRNKYGKAMCRINDERNAR